MPGRGFLFLAALLTPFCNLRFSIRNLQSSRRPRKTSALPTLQIEQCELQAAKCRRISLWLSALWRGGTRGFKIKLSDRDARRSHRLADHAKVHAESLADRGDGTLLLRRTLSSPNAF